MAADLAARISQAAEHIEVTWTPERAAEVLHGVHTTKRRRQKLQRLGVIGGLLLLIGAAPAVVQRIHSGSLASVGTVATVQRPASVLAEVPVALRLADGSLVQPQDQRSQVQVREQSPGRTVLQLHGAAQFDVVHDPQRLFRVETAGVAVEVLGTRFLVEPAGERVRVLVQEGRVRVLWAAHYAEVEAGQSALFPPVAELQARLPAQPEPPPLSEPVRSSADDATAVAPVSRGLAKPKSSHEVRVPQALTKAVESLPSAKSPSWESLASEGQYEKAYQLAYGSAVVVGKGAHAAEPELLSRPGATPGQLLLLADVARLSHHATEAVPPLQKLLLAHASDPRAPLAAFTLGRVLLDELGRPREAAESFQHAQQLDPTGPLAQDALAREVEAWSRAGELARARACAQQYLKSYPSGRRANSVRHFGELAD
jgi:transmembrane sensor